MDILGACVRVALCVCGSIHTFTPHTNTHQKQQLRRRFEAHLEAEYEASLAYDITAAGQGPDAFKGKWLV